MDEMMEEELREMVENENESYIYGYQVEIYNESEAVWEQEGRYPPLLLNEAVERCIAKAASLLTRGHVMALTEDFPIVYRCQCNETGLVSENGWYIEED